MIREPYGKIDEGSTLTHIIVLSGDTPRVIGSLVFFEEQQYITRVVCLREQSFDIESPLPRFPVKGELFDCGIQITYKYNLEEEIWEAE